MGLRAMVAADTAGVSPNHMQNAEINKSRRSSTYRPTTGQTSQQSQSGWPWCRNRSCERRCRSAEEGAINWVEEELVDRRSLSKQMTFLCAVTGPAMRVECCDSDSLLQLEIFLRPLYIYLSSTTSCRARGFGATQYPSRCYHPNTESTTPPMSRRSPRS